MDKKLIQTQLALFFKKNYSDNFENFSLKIKSKLGPSKTTTLNPLPDSAPAEIPRLVLDYGTSGFSINVAKSRLDLFFVHKDLIDRQINDIIDLLQNLDIDINRIGFVKTWFVSSGDTSSLRDIFVEDRLKGLNPEEINIRINSPIILLGYNCNNIEDLKYGRLKTKDKEEEGIILLRDINTLIRDSFVFDQIAIKEIINTLDQKTNSPFLILKDE